MMTDEKPEGAPLEWWAAELGSSDYGIGWGQTRQDCLRDALANTAQGDRIQIVEATTQDVQPDGDDYVPFEIMGVPQVIERTDRWFKPVVDDE